MWALGAISWTRDGPGGRDDLRGFSGIAGGGTLDEHQGVRRRLHVRANTVAGWRGWGVHRCSGFSRFPSREMSRGFGVLPSIARKLLGCSTVSTYVCVTSSF